MIKKTAAIIATMFVACVMTASAALISVQNGVMTYDCTQGDQWASIQNLNLQSADRAAITKLVIIGSFNGDNCLVNFNDWGIETLDLTDAVLGEYYAFKQLGNLKSIIWPTAEFIIPDGAFQTNSSSLKEVTIPSNCKEVKANAFTNHVIETVTIEGPSTIIRYQAFNNVKTVKDVYVLSGEETYQGTDWSGQEKTMYYCEVGAFDFWVTWVQTQIDRIDEAATLHVPADAQNIDNFINPNTDVLTQAVLCQKYHEDQVNGWREFIKNSKTIVASSQVFRTFSDTKDHLFPMCTDVTTGVKIYYVVGTTVVNGKQKMLIEPLNEKNDYLLPANTGVLVYTKKGLVINNTDNESGEQKIAQYAAATPLGNTNYLESLQDAPDNYYMSWHSTRRNVKCINMFLDNKKDTDEAPVEWGFYTIINKTYTKDEICYRAYLNMPEELIGDDDMHGFWDGNGDVPPSVDAKRVFDINLDDESFEEATAIVTTTIENNEASSNNAYYNAGGQQISGPAKGFYIHAGKKYMK